MYVACDSEEVVGVVSLQTMPNLGYDTGRPPSWRRWWWPRATAARASAACWSSGPWATPPPPAATQVQLLTHKRHATDGAHDFYRAVGFSAEAEGFRLYLDP